MNELEIFNRFVEENVKKLKADQDLRGANECLDKRSAQAILCLQFHLVR
jgi:hypothetical protein